jgi:hypothetical protein
MRIGLLDSILLECTDQIIDRIRHGFFDGWGG